MLVDALRLWAPTHARTAQCGSHTACFVTQWQWPVDGTFLQQQLLVVVFVAQLQLIVQWVQALKNGVVWGIGMPSKQSRFLVSVAKFHIHAKGQRRVCGVFGARMVAHNKD